MGHIRSLVGSPSGDLPRLFWSDTGTLPSNKFVFSTGGKCGPSFTTSTANLAPIRSAVFSTSHWWSSHCIFNKQQQTTTLSTGYLYFDEYITIGWTSTLLSTILNDALILASTGLYSASHLLWIGTGTPNRLSPETYLRRPPELFPEWRLDVLLKKKADQGVTVNIIVYNEVHHHYESISVFVLTYGLDTGY
jgi:hypothetical protein